jgi:glycosyltransferase involved in cell wall biosynthesis
MGLLKTFKEFKPDYVYSHLWFSNLVTKILKLSGLKFNLICYEHNVYDSVKTRKQFLFDRFTQSLPKKIIAVSEDVSRSLVRNGINSKNIITLNNAINIEKFSSVKKNFKAKMEFGIPRESFVFLHLGRFVPQKAHDVLLKAFSEVNKDSFLICAGDGGLRDAMIELSKKLDLSKRILFLKNINDSRKLFEVVDVFVLPSRHEGLSIALLEAMAAGMPVISSDYVGARKIIVHGENGYVVPIDNIKKLSYFMNEIIDNPGVIRKFSQKNKEDVSKYSIENYLNTLLMI